MVAPVLSRFGGIVTAPIGSVQAMAVQADGKIVVAGNSNSSSNSDFVVARYNADGTLDTSFGVDGFLTTTIGSGNDFVGDVQIQLDGKILVTGSTFTGAATDFATVRYNTDGTLDTSFGSTGIVTTPISISNDSASAILPLANGKIIVVGSSTQTGTGTDFTVVRYNADGTLDTTFDTDGILTTPVASGADIDAAYSVAVQADGKLVVAGDFDAGSATERDFAVIRYETNGSLDTSFGTNGIARIPIGTSNDFVRTNVLIQSDGKILVGGYSVTGGSGAIALIRLDENGILDPTFSGDGIVTTLPFSGFNIPSGIAVQTDGSILVAAKAKVDGADAFAILRYTSAGVLDSSFGSGGIVTTKINGLNDISASIEILAGGKILVSGTSKIDSSNNAFALVRYNSDGSVDTTFDPPAQYEEGGPAAALEPFLSISDADSSNLTGATVSITNGLTPGDQLHFTNQNGIAGVFDAITGILTLSGTSSVANYQTALRSITFSSTSEDPDNGGASPSRTVSFQVSDGTDTSATETSQVAVHAVNDAPVIEGVPENGDGIVTTNLGSDTSQAQAVAIQDGKLVVAGFVDNGTYDDFAVVRYHEDGSVDRSFGTNGIVWTPIGPASDDFAYDVAVQTDGKIVVVGNGGVFGGFTDTVVVRYNVDGTLDTSFAGDGKLIIPVDANVDGANAVAIQPDGKIVLAGYEGSTGNSNVALVRVNTNGTLDTSFGSGGIVSTNVGVNSEVANSVVLQTDGKIVVAGWVDNGSTRDFVVIRYNTNGTLDPSFDGEGIDITPVVGVFDDMGYAVALQADGKIVVAGVTFNVNTGNDFAVVRWNPDGSLDTSFDFDGKVFTAIGAGTTPESATSIVIQSDGKILAAGSTKSAGQFDFAIVRYNEDGSLDTTFGANGIVITPVGAGDDFSYDIVLQDDGKIVVVGAARFGTDSDFAVVRYNADGTLDTSFDPAKIIYTEDGAPATLTTQLALSDVDDTDLAGATVAITDGFVAGDQLNFSNQNGISGSYDAGAGILTLTGIASLADYQAALRSITFSSTSDDPDNGGSDLVRTISWQVTDGTDTSEAQTSRVSVNAVDDIPSAVNLTPVLTSIDENTMLPTRTKIADIAMVDPDGGVNTLGLTGDDAFQFELDGNELFLKAGVELDYETQKSLKVEVTVDADGDGTPDTTSDEFTFNVGNISPEIINGTANPETLMGGSDIDIISGFGGDDTLIGDGGNDTLDGGEGLDILRGGRGKDKLTGGLEADIFDFDHKNDSKKGSKRDTILDFERKVDTIDLKGVDAKKGGGNQKFKWIGKSDFSGKAGELRYEDKGKKVIVQGDIKGNGKVDFEILVKVGKVNDNDFIL